MEIRKTTEFADLKHSIHIFDTDGKRLADIDASGVKMHSDVVLVSVCKTTGEKEGWPEEELIYLPEILERLLKEK